MTLLISCGWAISGQCVKFVWSLLTCVCRLLTIGLCMTTMESYHQFIDVTSMHEDTRVLYQQLYDGHRRIGRHSRWEPGIDCWLGKKRANTVWSMMAYRDTIRARDEWVKNAFMICRGFQWTMITETGMALSDVTWNRLDEQWLWTVGSFQIDTMIAQRGYSTELIRVALGMVRRSWGYETHEGEMCSTRIGEILESYVNVILAWRGEWNCIY